MNVRDTLFNISDNKLDGTMLFTGFAAGIIDWMATHTDVVAIWVGSIVIPATIRIWVFLEKRRDNNLRRNREDELHRLELLARQQEIKQDQELHKKNLKR